MSDLPPTLVPNLPTAVRAFENKYASLNFSGIPKHVVEALQRIDYDRAVTGRTPVAWRGSPATLNLVRAGMDPRVAPTLPEEPNPWSVHKNFVSDLSVLAKSLVPTNLVKGFAGEVRDLLDGIEDDVKEGGVANIPGVRMLPGAFVVQNIGNPRELARHPLFTVLDVLPYVKRVAAATPVVRAAEAARVADVEAGRFAPQVNPIRTVLTRRLDGSGGVVPNRVGRLAQKWLQTPTGEFLARSFGPSAQDISRQVGLANAKLESMVKGVPDPSDAVAVLANEMVGLATDDRLLFERYKMTRDRAAEITKALSVDDRAVLDSLTPEESLFVDRMRAAEREIARHNVISGDVVDIGGEIYTKAAGARIARARELFRKRFANVIRGVPNDPTSVEVVVRDLYNADPVRWGKALEALESVDMSDVDRLRVLREEFAKNARIKTNASVSPFETSAEGLQTGQTYNRIFNMARADLEKAWRSWKSFEKVQRKTAPARFDDLINRKAVERYAELADLSPEKFDQLFDAVNSDLLDKAPWVDGDLWRQARSEAAATWQEMKAAGANPMFVHRVSPDKAKQIVFPRVVERIPSLSQAKDRVADLSPHVDDLTVALSHQAVEILKRRVATDLAETIGRRYGVQEQVLRDRFQQQAEFEAAQGFDRRTSVGTKVEMLIKEQYVPYDPTNIIPFAAGFSGTNVAAEQIWIPKVVADTVRQMHEAGWTNFQGTAVEAATGVMRTSLLPLSPRWHTFNMIGGAIMLATQDPRAFANMIRGMRIARAAAKGEVPSWLPDEIRYALGSMTREEAELRFRTGQTLSRWFNPEKVPGREAFSRLIAKSFEFNQLFDDMYRATAYLTGHDRALVKGMSREVAEHQGIELARKVLQDVQALTPFERNVLRPIFPFYSFNGFLVRWAMRYPFDHPTRAAIISAVGRYVLEEHEDPNSDMLDAFIFGGIGKEGKQKGISTSGINPFADVSNLFTFAGWVGALNPVGRAVADTLGISASGQADLYPNLSYDRTTGRLTIDTPNPILSLVHATIPQSRIITAVIGANKEFNSLLRRDRDAAMRLLYSNAGIPIIIRDYNPTRDAMLREMKRSESQTLALTEAMKSGDYSKVARMPGLAEKLEMLRNMPPEQLAQFVPPERSGLFG